MARVGHQHAIAAGKAQIGGQRSGLVAALFLDDLDEQHLAALDDVLDLVAAAQRHALRAQVVGFLRATATALLAAAPTALAIIAALAFLAAVIFFGCLGGFFALFVRILETVLD